MALRWYEVVVAIKLNKQRCLESKVIIYWVRDFNKHNYHTMTKSYYLLSSINSSTLLFIKYKNSHYIKRPFSTNSYWNRISTNSPQVFIYTSRNFLNASVIMTSNQVSSPTNKNTPESSKSRAFASIPDRPSNLSFEARPEIKQQTFDEIYGVPENFLEIEVSISNCIYTKL